TCSRPWAGASNTCAVPAWGSPGRGPPTAGAMRRRGRWQSSEVVAPAGPDVVHHGRDLLVGEAPPERRHDALSFTHPRLDERAVGQVLVAGQPRPDGPLSAGAVAASAVLGEHARAKRCPFRAVGGRAWITGAVRRQAAAGQDAGYEDEGCCHQRDREA